MNAPRVARLLPKSLIGQIALVMAAALLVAQAINFSLILTERQRLSRTRSEGPAIARFVLLAQRVSEAGSEMEDRLLPRRRRTRISIDGQSLIAPAARDAELTQRLRDSASTSALVLRDARAATLDRPPPRWRSGSAETERRRSRWKTMLLSAQLADGRWVNARVAIPRPDPWLAVRPAIATLLTYLIVLAAMIWVASRLARPLRDLAAAADRFGGQSEAPRVEPSGPADLVRAIKAFNAMSARVGAMLDEKDRMLGAIGHDLRTPLASLRIRAETVEPEEERQRMIATIEEMATTLDDTLALARAGRAVEAERMVDVTALADTVVEEFRELGKPAEMTNGPRATALVQPSLLRRAVRNLVDNAITHGGSARVAVREEEQEVIVEVTDEGPGIPESEIERVTDSFYRVEPSRSRSTGGAGLGLTLARAAAQAHGGRLVLENRPEGGLAARLLLPAPRAQDASGG